MRTCADCLHGVRVAPGGAGVECRRPDWITSGMVPPEGFGCTGWAPVPAPLKSIAEWEAEVRASQSRSPWLHLLAIPPDFSLKPSGVLCPCGCELMRDPVALLGRGPFYESYECPVCGRVGYMHTGEARFVWLKRKRRKKNP